MKASTCAAKVGRASVVLSLLALLAGCSLETTGSGDFSLSADDDAVDTEDAQNDDAEDPQGDDHGSDDGDDGGDGGDPDASKSGDADAQGKDGGPGGGDDTCRPGSYQGTFSCKQPTFGLAWAASLNGNEITGSFTFRLEPTGKANSLELTGGQLHSEDNAFFKLDATIVATLECGRPLRGKLDPASYTIIFGAPTPFESPFDATYDEATGSFQDGTWVVKSDTTTQCNGTWSATRSSD